MLISKLGREKDSYLERELQSLLAKWAAIEPQCCRRNSDSSFDVRYLSDWLKVTAQPASHGTIIAAVLSGCQDNQIHCEIDYTARYEDHAAEIQVGCVPGMFRYDLGDEAISSIPVLLLTEYLERLEAGR